MKRWTVVVGQFQVDVVDSVGDTELVEVCTRALETLHEREIDYSVGSKIKAICNGKTYYTPTDVVLANAGKYYEARELQRQIALSKGNRKSKSLPVDHSTEQHPRL